MKKSIELADIYIYCNFEKIMRQYNWVRMVKREYPRKIFGNDRRD